MNFKITGDGIVATSALREHAHTQFLRVLQNCTSVPTVEVVIKSHDHADKNQRHTATVNVQAEVNAQVEGKVKITRTATTGDMYASIDKIANLVDAEIKRQKDIKVKPKGLVVIA